MSPDIRHFLREVGAALKSSTVWWVSTVGAVLVLLFSGGVSTFF